MVEGTVVRNVIDAGVFPRVELEIVISVGLTLAPEPETSVSRIEIHEWLKIA